ncbi:Chaperone protein HtpG [Aquicella siphonis]|uniref:Chaperone protein HtpG n=1 Tax=Aquicella siphonis TaxID=254247 RepID=A0A5E4PH06_9COXI|nr:molecular chaperone HtpG [Aquicella siphonis]VVC75798.1 Chaperone protein HtpG [Aquicella siphonis]
MTLDAHQEKLNFQAEVKQLLDIVVHSLYSNKEIFLRELISNASDAIDKLRFESLSDPALYESDSNLGIRIRFDNDAKTITISDNGIGMSRDEVVENLGTIAKSGTREFLSRLTGDQKKDAHLIGQFGVGFYSSFIVADRVTVITRRAGLGSAHGVRWESKGDGEYTVANLEKTARGTDVILHLKEGEEEFLNEWRLRSIITKYSDHLNIPIMMPKRADDGKETAEWETVNRATALWSLPKSAVTVEQYREFYKHIAHDFEDPLAWTHHKIEGGNIDYTCLLYLPSHAPFDLWQRDTHHGLKLYVQRVFIMDQVEQFMPHYLRFVRGVLDTTALPLNISREILQDHPSIPKLRSAMVRHVLDLLERIAKDEPEKYVQFWKEFGNVLKEGPAEDFTNREKIGKLLRFASTHGDAAEQTVSLDEYLQRMKPAQKKIYYITADTINAARFSPHLEIFRKNDIEVLLLTDRIDEWVVGHMPEYDGKPFQSVAKGDLQLDEIIPDSAEEKKLEENKEHEQQQTFDALLKKIHTLLEKNIKEVRLSHRLTDSPACLVRDQNALGPQMERLLKAAGQQVSETKPILELNPDHMLVRKLLDEKDEMRLSDWTHIIFDQALLAEGGALPDPAEYVQRVNKLWMEMFR